ncbi:MAG: hypothetical protein H6Q05_3404 [Acidobacteria bacterium]|nr:hypothetical protein [Acidobacteriota bacterium]
MLLPACSRIPPVGAQIIREFSTGQLLLSEGLSMNKVCILARAPGGQVQGAATQAM